MPTKSSHYFDGKNYIFALMFKKKKCVDKHILVKEDFWNTFQTKSFPHQHCEEIFQFRLQLYCRHYRN